MKVPRLLAALRGGRTRAATPDPRATWAAIGSADATCRLLLAGRLSADAAHEISNHLQVILGNAELLGSATTLSPRERARLAMIGEAGALAVTACTALKDVARAGRAGHRPVAFGELVDAERDVLARLAGAGVDLVTDLDPAARASVPGEAVRVATPTILHALVALARPFDARDRLTLHGRLRPVPGEPAEPPHRAGSGLALELHVEFRAASDGRADARADEEADGLARTATAAGATLPPSPDAEETELLGALAGLVDRIGGRCAVSEADGRGTCRVVLPT